MLEPIKNTDEVAKGTNSDDAVTSFLLPDGKPNVPTTSKEFRETQKTPNISKSRSGDLTSYRGYVPNVDLDTNMDKTRAYNQGAGEQFINAFGQFGGQFVAGASMALGTALDFEQAVKTVKGTEQEYSNLLYDFGKGLLESSSKSMPIYEVKPGKVNPSDPAWWATHFAQTGLSAGIMAESIAETFAITALTQGTGLGAEIGAIGNKLRNLKGIKNLMSTGNTSSKLRNAATTFGVINRHHEGIMEAADSFDNTYKELVAKGTSIEKAKEIAGKAASNTYLANLPLMALDILQFRAMTFNPMSGSSTGGMIENVLSKIPSKRLATGAAFGFNMVTEAGEEFWQSLVQSEAKSNADIVAGFGDEKTFGERFRKYSEEGEIWNAAIAGAFGSVILGGMAKGFQKATEGSSRKELDAQYKKFVDSMTGLGVEMSDSIRKAEEQGDEAKANNLRRQMGIQKALHAVHLDNLKDSEAAFTSYIDQLGQSYEAANSKDQAKTDALGITGSEDFLAKNIPSWLQDAQEIKAIYDETKMNNTRDAVVPITYRKFLLNNLSQEVTNVQAKIQATKASMPDLSNLSAAQKDKHEADINIALWTSKLNELTKELNTKSTLEERSPIQAEINSVNFNINKNTEISERNASIIEEEVADKDVQQSILDLLSGNKTLEKLYQTKVQLESETNRIRKELSLWSSPEFQNKKKDQQLVSLIDSASTVQELNSIKNSLKDNNIAKDKINKAIAQKEAELKVSEETEKIKAKEADPVTDFLNPDATTITSTKVDSTGGVLLEDILKQQRDLGNKPQGNTPFGNILPATEEDVKLAESPVRKEIATAIDEAVGPVVSTKDTSGATVIESGDMSFFSPAVITDNLTDEQKDKVKSSVLDYYNSLNLELGKKPTFKQLVEDMILNTSVEQTEYNFNAIKLGWELNDLGTVDFNKIYNELFGDRKSKVLEFFEFTKTIVTEEEYREQQEEETKEEELQEAQPANIIETETGTKVLKTNNKFVTVRSDLKFAFLSAPYIESREEDGDDVLINRETEGDELNQGQYVNSKELLDPNKYQPGTKLEVNVPTGFENIMVSQWDSQFRKTTPIRFGDWAKGKDVNSDEYIGKVPIIINSPYTNSGVAFVHDVDWYNPTNIASTENPKEQAEIIARGKQEVLDFRKNILQNQGKGQITITEKSAGNKLIIPKNKPLVTLASTNPQAMVSFPDNLGDFVVGNTVIESSQVINGENVERGHKYDLRQVGVQDGKPTYFASKLHYDKISPEVKMSLIQAVRVYISQFDDTEVFSSKQEINTIREGVKKATGLDLFDKQGLESYLGIFVPTVKGNAKKVQDIYNIVVSNDAVLNGSPFLAMQNGSIVYGIKGVKVDGKNNENYFNPMKFRDDPAKASVLANNFLQRLFKDDVLGSLTQNVNKEHLQKDTNVAIIKYDINNKKSSVEEVGKYQEYLKTKLKTNLKSFDLGNGTFGTFVQPTINFSYEGKVQESSERQNEAEVTEDKLPTPGELARQVAQEITGNETPKDVEDRLIKDITSDLAQYAELGLSAEVMATLQSLNPNIKFDPEYAKLTDDMVKSMKTKLSKIEDISITDRKTVVQFMANEIMTKINPQTRNVINKKELISEINKTFSTIISPKVKLVDEKISSLRSLYDTGKYPDLLNVINEFENIKVNADILSKNWNYFINEAFDNYVSKFTGIDVKVSKDQSTVNVAILEEDTVKQLLEQEETQQEFNIEFGDEREKDYSKESLEDNGKNSTSYLLKRFFAQIPSYDTLGNPKKGFMGLTSYPGFDFYYDAVGQLMSSPVPVESDFKSVLVRLEQHKEGKPWVSEVIKRLNEADEQLKNSFMYNLRENLTMKFVMTSYNRDFNNYKLKVYDTNANEITRNIQNRWRQGFKQSGLVFKDDTINIDKATELKNTFNSWAAKATVPTRVETQQWLKGFGIDLGTEAISEVVDKGYYVTDAKGKAVLFPYRNMFIKSDSTLGLFGALARSLDLMISAENKNYVDNDNINPFENIGGILNKISNIEAKYTSNPTTNTFRDGTKSIYGYTPHKFATNFVSRLKTDSKLREQKKQISFDQSSFILQMFDTNEDFATKFSVDHIGINAFKQLGVALYKDNELNSLSDADHELVNLGMFQDMQQGSIKYSDPNIPMRMARMFFPTMSDKKTMLDILVPVLDLKTSNFTYDNGVAKISEGIKSFLFSQLIEPELKRIVEHHKKAKALGVSPNSLVNQEGYNMGAQIFHFIPEMNNMMYVNKDGSETRLIEFIAQANAQIDEEVYNAIKENIQDKSFDLLDELFNKLKQDKINTWESNDYLSRTVTGNIGGTNFLDSRYLDSRGGTTEQKVETAALDYVINSAVTLANIHMLIAGDVANYSVDKAFRNNFIDGKPYMPVSNDVYAKISQNVIGTNLGKRLALLIAPGSILAESKNDKYIQLFLKDRVSISQNIEYLIDLYYGKQTDVIQEKIINAKAGVKSAIKELMEEFPEIADYFNIESTDAQEYTTVKEAIDVLYRQGRMSVVDYKTVNTKIIQQKKAELDGVSIPESALLSQEELALILQPIKPAYTGNIPDVENNLSRIVYIKSSSFPLIPQTTMAFPALNSLRKEMEKIESKTGKNVRASYNTANKVGAVLSSNQLEIWDNEGNFIEDSINSDDIVSKLQSGQDTSALVLDRENFRIQQDVPFKSLKSKSQDTITLATQPMKLILGSGISKIKDEVFTYRGKKVSGEYLSKVYNESFDRWIRDEKTKFYESIGVDENTGQVIDKVKSIQKLQNVLKEEAKKRGYPQQDIEALELDTNGDLKSAQFIIPLWLSPNSNRYEALLNAMVTNKLINLTLPGNSFVVGSEEGFKMSEDLSQVDESKVIFTNSWKGELRATRNEDGTFKTAQVLIPSKLRNRDGSLLDLFSKDKDGEFIYITQKDNGSYFVKEGMIDPELLSNPSFRIPTSSHVSMSQIEIVGFLPIESGDLMIVPKNFTKQKGLDYDVDKENMYSLHHTIDENGKVVVADYDTKIEEIDEDIKLIEDYLVYLADKSEQDKNLIQDYKDEILLSESPYFEFDNKDARKFIKELKKEVTITNSKLKDSISELKKLKNLKVKLLQNEIVRVHSAVLGTQDEEVQRKINKVLSTQFAEEQANLLDALNTKQSNPLFTILSDEYQKSKMALGAAGKLGIGVYSNFVVFHSQIQQSEKTLRLMTKEFTDDGKVFDVPYTLTIGNIKSEGYLGRQTTLDEGRLISDALAESQNTATDNEKLQIMGRTNINEFTVNVHATLAVLGFDKTSATFEGEKVDISIPYFLMSQPIIKDYVKMMSNVKSNIAKYNPNAEQEVIDSLNKKYNPEEVKYKKKVTDIREALTGDKLISNIQDNGADGLSQVVILDIFNEIKDFGKTMADVQSKLYIHKSGLGKSFLEMMEKYNNVGRLSNNTKIDNISSLVGDYLFDDDFYNMSREEMLEQGYVIFDDSNTANPFAVKPTTASGSMLVHSTKSGYQLWKDYFPHHDRALYTTINSIVEVISGQEVSELKKVNLQHEIFEELKKYLYSSSRLGLFSGDPQIERARLFKDTDTNTSIANYLFTISRSENEKDKAVINDNKLLSRFQFNIETGSLPSTIRFDNSRGEEFNEEYKYLALVELMDKNQPLPDYNGQPYTTRMLAKDLILYTYLEGGVQQAIQFTKYVPVAYLKEIGFADITQLWQRAANGERFITPNGTHINVWNDMLGVVDDENSVTRFVMQYLQHNPNKLPKISEEDIFRSGTDLVFTDPKDKKLTSLKSFSMPVNFEFTPFRSVYNKYAKKGESKFQLYQYIEDKYVRIPTLGVFGMNEYSIKSNNVVPIVDSFKEYPNEVYTKPIIKESSTTSNSTYFFNIQDGNLTKSLEEIIEANIPGSSEMAKALLPYLNNSIKLELSDMTRGNATYLNNVITVNKKFLASTEATKEKVAQLILHEYVHSITVDLLKQHLTEDGTPLNPNQELPSNIRRLQRLFKEVEAKLGTDLEEFKQWYSKNPGKIRTESDRILYAGMDIFEFTAMILSEADIQKKMSEFKYMATDRTLLEQLVETLKKILETVGINFDENTVTSQAISTLFEILEDTKPKKVSTQFGVISEPNETDLALGKLLDKEDLGTEDTDESFLSPSEENNLQEDCIF